MIIIGSAPATEEIRAFWAQVEADTATGLVRESNQDTAYTGDDLLTVADGYDI